MSQPGGAPSPPHAPPLLPGPAAAAGKPPIPHIAPEGAVCLQCAYGIQGQPSDSRCPECGTPVSRSLRGPLLVYSATGYVGQLRVGVTCILLAAMLNILVAILSGIASVVVMVMTFMQAGRPVPPNAAQLWVSVMMLPVSTLALIGWWLFSAPDPAVRVEQQGQRPRIAIRATVAAMACASVLDLASRVLAMRHPALFLLGVGGAGVVVGLAQLVQFFAAMLYIRWLAPRLPDPELAERARTYMWLLPVIYIAGSCLIIGPLISAVLYLLMLLRIHDWLGAIRQAQRGALAGP